MRMYEVHVVNDDKETITIPVASVQIVRDALAEHAPLPWAISGNSIVDAGGNVILHAVGGEAGRRVLGAVLTGVASVGGYKLEN